MMEINIKIEETEQGTNNKVTMPGELKVAVAISILEKTAAAIQEGIKRYAERVNLDLEATDIETIILNLTVADLSEKEVTNG